MTNIDERVQFEEGPLRTFAVLTYSLISAPDSDNANLFWNNLEKFQKKIVRMHKKLFQFNQGLLNNNSPRRGRLASAGKFRSTMEPIAYILRTPSGLRLNVHIREYPQ